ncbi:MAG: CocE/NonD family hydrolase [Candidatus Latescibacter sp.]|nr:CocE/NonD family hydrolase [Candidatus Latescibacter sp.]
MKAALLHFRTTLLAAFFAAILPAASIPSFCQEKAPVKVEEIALAASDGIKLATIVVRPEREGKFPTVIFRSPYGADWMKSYLQRFAQRGYACVYQDVRGRYNSGGVFDPFVNEIPDGDVTLRWIRSQPWSNGVVGSSGHSYLGFTALYLSAGKETPPQVIVASDPVASPLGGLYTNGAMNHHFDYYWAILVDGKDRDLQPVISLDWERLFPLLPLSDAPRLGVNSEIPHYKKWVDWANGSFGKGLLPQTSRLACDNSAVLLMGGWFDLFCPDVLKLYTQLRARSSGEKVKLIVGPFDHGSDPPPESEMDFGNWKSVNIQGFQDRWLDRWLLDSPNGADKEPAVRFFLMGDNRWVSAAAWPPAGTTEKSLYLHCTGKANTLRGKGMLNGKAPAKEPYDAFTYDPGNPVPTRGGSICCLREMTKAGAMDQRVIEGREDVLVYTTGVIDRDITVVGQVELELFASTSARDTDFTGKLVDVGPEGKALNITESIVRARFRNGMGDPQFLTPGAVERYRFSLGQTAMTFLKGHRIRLEVSSSNFPRFDRNLNTGGPIGAESSFVKADQKIFHDREHPSRLILSVWDKK